MVSVDDGGADADPAPADVPVAQVPRGGAAAATGGAAAAGSAASPAQPVPQAAPRRARPSAAALPAAPWEAAAAQEAAAREAAKKEADKRDAAAREAAEAAEQLEREQTLAAAPVRGAAGRQSSAFPGADPSIPAPAAGAAADAVQDDVLKAILSIEQQRRRSSRDPYKSPLARLKLTASATGASFFHRPGAAAAAGGGGAPLPPSAEEAAGHESDAESDCVSIHDAEDLETGPLLAEARPAPAAWPLPHLAAEKTHRLPLRPPPLPHVVVELDAAPPLLPQVVVELGDPRAAAGAAGELRSEDPVPVAPSPVLQKRTQRQATALDDRESSLREAYQLRFDELALKLEDEAAAAAAAAKAKAPQDGLQAAPATAGNALPADDAPLLEHAVALGGRVAAALHAVARNRFQLNGPSDHAVAVSMDGANDGAVHGAVDDDQAKRPQRSPAVAQAEAASRKAALKAEMAAAEAALAHCDAAKASIQAQVRCLISGGCWLLAASILLPLPHPPSAAQPLAQRFRERRIPEGIQGRCHGAH